jgi:peroxiredoxin
MRILCFLLLISTGLRAQVIVNFTLTNAANGKAISLSDYSSFAGVVIIFSSNECPYDAYYRSRMIALHQHHAGKVPVLLVNAHIGEKESVEKMKELTNSLSLSMPYLADKQQEVLRLLDAHKSPECFLLKNSGGKFSVIYRGALDDNAQSETDVNHPYLADAIANLLGGTPVQQREVRPVGCSIRTQ